ncbi:MAG: sulfite exporter TauE/SafE family protein [Bacteroidales bacterium]|nr:sulfite exporter TauE/SafE family protein [Bacteroidales bacterium]
MNQELWILTGSAASIGFFHTLFGPDHYLPFVMMARARGWSQMRTAWITLVCGIGHVGSSLVLGALGLLFGLALGRLELLEGVRGDLAAWAFVLFGLGYTVWAAIRLARNKPHRHLHLHSNGLSHSHDHDHSGLHDHIHRKSITPWLLFLIFVLGPCEPLIPLLMYPAASESTTGLVMVSSVFALTTIGTMMAMVVILNAGLGSIRFSWIEKYMHILAGVIIMASGMAILFLGL